MIKGVQGGKAIIFYFLQPDKHGNLILRGKETPPTSTTRFIVEEYFPSFKTTLSYITPSWTGQSKTFIWRYKKFNDHSEYPKEDRKKRLIDIILRTFGYNDKTHPTIEKIIRMSRGDRNNKLDFDMEEQEWIHDEPSGMYEVPINYTKNHPKRKEFIPLLKAERLLTEGQFEENSYPVALRKKKVLKSKIKKNLKKIKCRCKNERK
jgi:hypothetical protein